MIQQVSVECNERLVGAEQGKEETNHCGALWGG